jgi:hypothetical protein
LAIALMKVGDNLSSTKAIFNIIRLIEDAFPQGRRSLPGGFPVQLRFAEFEFLSS